MYEAAEQAEAGSQTGPTNLAYNSLPKKDFTYGRHTKQRLQTPGARTKEDG